MRHVASQKKFYSYEFFYDSIRKGDI